MDNFSHGAYDVDLAHIMNLNAKQNALLNGTASSLMEDLNEIGYKNYKTVVLAGTKKACDSLCDVLNEKGFSRYEISNFAIPGYESKHNINYWLRGDYIGIGLSASSLIDNRRFTNTYRIDDYINKVIANKMPETSSEDLTLADQMFETIMLGLRMDKGFSIEDFNNKFQTDFCTVYKNPLQKNSEYLQIKDGYLSVKPEYLYVENGIIIDFMI
jgi:oxygen-independent coproporphyrinogen-3 oxidase